MTRTRRRGYTLIEALAALTLTVVLMGAVFPPLHAEVAYVRGRLEVESARLIVEGELSHALQEAAAGRLAPGARPLSADAYPSRAQLEALELQRTVRPAPGTAGRAGLLEVTVRATWQSAAAAPGRRGTARRQQVELSTWARGTP